MFRSDSNRLLGWLHVLRASLKSLLQWSSPPRLGIAQWVFFFPYRSVLSVHLPALFFVLLHAEVDEPDRSVLIDTQVTDCGGIIVLF